MSSLHAAFTESFENPSWIQWFKFAAFGQNSEQPTGGMTADGLYYLDPNRNGSIVTEAFSTPDLGIAMHELRTNHSLANPPIEWRKLPNPVCTGTTTIDPDDYVDGIVRRDKPKRKTGLYFESCPTNTYYGLGWLPMRGYQHPRPAPVPWGCAPPVFYQKKV